jgi:hypothetical protein
MGARRYAAALRGHWGIENQLHWQLLVPAWAMVPLRRHVRLPVARSAG